MLLPAGLVNHCTFHHSPRQHIFYETCSLNVEQTAREIEREGKRHLKTDEFNFISSETERDQQAEDTVPGFVQFLALLLHIGVIISALLHDSFSSRFH